MYHDANTFNNESISKVLIGNLHNEGDTPHKNKHKTYEFSVRRKIVKNLNQF